MKTLTLNQLQVKSLLLLLALMTLLAAFPVKAQDVLNTEYTKENVTAGISSENNGVRKNMIYLAGKYKLEFAADALMKQLKSEDDAETKVLIALALYKINSKEGMDAVKETAVSTAGSGRVKRMLTKIYAQYAAENRDLSAGF